jgi:chromosome segregation ATPase
MLNINTNSPVKSGSKDLPKKKSVIGSDDPFDKKKLAEEARLDAVKIKEDKRKQEQDKIQLQISNRERELARLEQDLRLKESQFMVAKKKAEDARKDAFLLAGQIKKDEGGASYLEAEASLHDSRAVASEASLQEVQADLLRKERERQALELTYRNMQTSLRDLDLKSQKISAKQGDGERSLRDLEIRISKLKTELSLLVAESDKVRSSLQSDESVKIATESDSLRKEILDIERGLDLKRSEITALEQKIKGLELGTKQVIGERARVSKDVQIKTKEIKGKNSQLFTANRLVEQLERENTLAQKTLADLRRDSEEKKREIDDLKRQKDAIR